MKLKISTILLFGLLSVQNAFAQWSTDHYGFNDTHIHEEVLSVDSWYDIKLSIVFHEIENDLIEVDTIIAQLQGTTVGIKLTSLGSPVVNQDPKTKVIYWILDVGLELFGGIGTDSITLLGQLTVTPNSGSDPPNTSNWLYEKPTIPASFRFFHRLYVYHSGLMVFCFFLMSFQKGINRKWLFIVLLITPVIGPSIYVLNRFYISIGYIKSIFKSPQTKTPL